MVIRTVLLIFSILLSMSIYAAAEVTEPQPDTKKLESMGIKDLIEKSKEVSSEEQAKIKTELRERIAQANREKRFK